MSELVVLTAFGTLLGIVISMIVLAEKISQHMTSISRALTGFGRLLKKIGGGTSVFFGSMFVAVTPFGVWNAVTRTPTTSTYGLGGVIVASMITGLFFGTMGLMMICYGIAYAAPQSRLGKRFRRAMKKDTPMHPIRMSYIAVLKLGLAKLAFWCNRT